MTTAREPQQHLKISDYLKEQIRTGELKPGDRLPSEAELCEQFNTSRGPVRQALASLRTEGTISSGRGRRSIVLGNHQYENFKSMYSITEWMRLRGFEPSQKTLWQARRPAPAHVAEALGIKEGDPIVFVHRVRYGNGVPVMVERQYYPLEVGKHILNFDADSGSIHDHLEKHGVNYDNVYRELNMGYADREDAIHLGVEEGHPMWFVRLHMSDHAGATIEFAEYHYLVESMSLGISTVRGATSPLEVILNDQTQKAIEDAGQANKSKQDSGAASA